MSPEKTVLLSLTTGAVMLLTKLLSQPNWMEGDQSTLHLFRAGAVLELPEFEVGKMPSDGEDAVRTWLDRAVKVDLPLKQFETVKHCVQWHARKGWFGAGRAPNIVLREFGLAPEGE